METAKLLTMIENGKQVGIDKIIHQEGKRFAYTYAVQKRQGKYIVYTDEYDLDNYYAEDTEKIQVYDTLENFLENFDHKYDVKFEDVDVSKGQKFFYAEGYVQ